MTEQEKINLINKIDFGDIDGYGEPKLEEYFLDNDYWNKVINGKTFFVIGKKGTGKSSIYRMIYEQSLNKGVLIDNKDFGDFPFEKLLSLSDDNFAKPNQYQSVWENLILNVFAKKISENSLPGDESNTHFNIISEYSKKCLGNLIEMHKEVVSRTSKTSMGLSYNLINGSHEIENTLSLGNGNNNISQINFTLKQEILNYLKTCSNERSVIIQFDRLDDNYNQYQNVDQYYQCIISLFKVVYKINQEFRSCNINSSKVIVYLRSDILKELNKKDAESARWVDFSLHINWSIVNKNDWNNPLLLQMINKRITSSLKNQSIGFKELFEKDSIDLRKNWNQPVLDPFQYVIEKTLHRPRDLIQFCKCIQKECIETNQLNFRTIKNAEKKYSDWLVRSEIANEINPILKDTDYLYEFLKLLGQRPFSLRDFSKYSQYIEKFNMTPLDLASYLYDIGIVQNVDVRFKPYRYSSSYRNEGKFDRNLKIIIHPGVWKGINS